MGVAKMKRLLLFLFLAALPLPVQAAPKWLKRTAQVLAIAAPVGTSLWASHEVLGCRHRTDVANCTGGYGPVYAREYGVRLGLSITTSGLSFWGHKQSFREWFAPAVGMAAFNSFVAVHESRIKGGTK